MAELEFNKQLQAHETSIPGLLVFDLAVFGDNRGWFKENWQREKMLALGLPDFGPVIEQPDTRYRKARPCAGLFHACNSANPLSCHARPPCTRR